jgi:hypothetical protein
MIRCVAFFTDGRDWATSFEPTFQGYSSGKWVDENGDGHYNVLEVETRGFKRPEVSYSRTACRLMEGKAYVPGAVLDASSAQASSEG